MLFSMNLPVPNAEEVERFKELYREHRGEDLDPDQALDLATRFLHFYYFCVTPVPEHMIKEKEASPVATPNPQRHIGSKLGKSRPSSRHKV